MYKVLLVDDEMYVRKGLRGLIDWEALGYQVCGEADNGEEALRLIEERQPDVVITDIRMPALDGLELIERVKTRSVGACKFIILSGYNDFSYAQSAIRFGVSDYILKPIEEQDLEEMLRRLGKRITEERRERVSLERQIARETVEQAAAGTAAPESLQLLAQMLRIRPGARLCCGIAEASRGSEAERTQAEPERLNDQELEIVTNAYFSLTDGSRGAPFPLQNGRFGFIVCSDKLGQFGGHFVRFAESLQSLLTCKLQSPVTVYMGETVADINLLGESVRTVGTALQYKYVAELKDVIFAERAKEIPLSYAEPDGGLVQAVMEAVEEHDKERIASSAAKLFDCLRKKPTAKDAVRTMMNRLILQAIGTLQEMSGGADHMAALKPMLDWEERPVTLNELQALFTRFMQDSSAIIDRLRRDQTKGSIHKIKAYIEARYQENITLKSIAAEFYMNPVYVGQLFKKHYGMYFNEFLLSIRIGEARKLLRQTDLRIYEVAEKIGFNNADYFVCQFEKLEGMSPTEYRKKLLHQQ